MSLVVFLEPAPADLPERLPSPFAPIPHPVARRAAEALMGQLAERSYPELAEPGRGKMFGVLVVEQRGRIGYLQAFSGMLDGRWVLPGFVPPLFEPGERDAFWPAGEAELDALEAEHRGLAEAAAPLARELQAIDGAHAAARGALLASHAANRARRHAARQGSPDAARLHALAQESRRDTAELRRLDGEHAAGRAPLVAALAELEARRRRLETDRAERSRQLWERIHGGYVLADARGGRHALASLFPVPPGGAGDCAAPKLLGHAYREGLRPVAFAEFWWGAPPLSGGRHHGVFYPACRGKCGVVLPVMLEGLDVEPAPLWGADEVAEDQPRVVLEDEWLIIVDKPAGLLSVPGRHDKLRDSVLVRLRRHTEAPLVVHRLDLDTSGLLLAAKDPETYVALQRLFARHEIDKRYIAWLDGVVAADSGRIELPVRVDPLDRPRQVHDAVHGKRALTEWRVLARDGGRTRVAFTPRTGRTHQLRVHAAHPLGLGAPIVGDRLYGRPDGRLLLHAEALAFVHPRTGQRVSVVSPAPF